MVETRANDSCCGAALAAASHHSAQQYAAPRGQTTGTKAREGEVREQYYGLQAQERPLPGMRPAPLLEVLPQVGLQRHTVEQRIVHTPYVQILDAPVPQKVEQLVDFFKNLDIEVPAQVIEVPKISQDIIPQRSVDLVPQMAEQLVEVPTVLSPTRIALRIAEQIVDTPVPRGNGQGSLPQDRVQQRRLHLWNAFLSGLWSRSLAFLLLVVAWDAGLPHLLVLQMRILLGVIALFPMEKVRSTGQVVSVQLGGHVSSSTLSAHQMARAGEPADSDGSIEWVKLHVGETDQTCYWNRRSAATSWPAPAGVKVVWMGGKSDGGMVWYFNQVTGHTAHALPPLPPG